MASYPMVAAIDFGTTNSGYGFSTKNDFETSPLKISSVSWTAGSARLQSQKCPTCVLFDPQKNFHSFGYNAEDKISELALDEEEGDWYCFRRFKMELYNRQDITIDFELETEDGKKKMKAIYVFSAAIKFLKDHLDRTAAKQGVKFGDGDILWILTVPAIWTEPAKQFMRKAAEQAGIPSKHLKLVLEPEAAAIYCTHLPIDKMSSEGAGQQMTVFQKGTRYMVLDAGGGTIDITVHEVQSRGILKEIYRATGGDWGGTTVDREFDNILQDIVGEKLFKDFKSDNMLDILNLHRNFELKKRAINREADGSITFTIPPGLQQVFKKSVKGGDTEAALAANKKYANVSWKRDKLKIPIDLAKGLFGSSIDAIISQVKKIFSAKEVRGTSIILMVGGYSECELLQQAIKEAFKDKKIIIPNEAGLSILKGAVINGHAPNIITDRVCRFTYGVACNKRFIEGKDKEEYRVKGRRGDNRCINRFKVYITAGVSVQLGEIIQKYKFHVANKNETGIDLPVYATEDPNPIYVTDDDCQRLGVLRIEMPDIKRGIDREAEVEMILGGTELAVKAIDLYTKEETVASLNFLG